jgi:GNAT superfamily N-acetyltransferase
MLSDEENVAVLIDAWKLMVGRLPGSTIEHSRGTATMFGHVPLPFLNISAADHPLRDTEDLRGVLEIAKERAQACKHGSLFALCTPWAPPEWESVAAQQGFAVALNMTGMAADELLPPRRPAPRMELRRVADETTARDLAYVNAQAYGMPMELFDCICNLNLWHQDSHGYVGYVDGKAVTTAATFPLEGSVYVAFVATLPDSHGKGFAEAVMRHAIEQGSQAMGVKRLTLHASDMGRPLYLSMGFESGSQVVLLAGEHFAEPH